MAEVKRCIDRKKDGIIFIVKLPRLKIILIILTVLIAGGLFFWRGKSIKIIGKNSYLSSSLLINRDKDSDNDGLKDWEEAIYGTDKNNPDTDGDGANDKEEIVSGRDPLKKGPDDKLGPAVVSNSNSKIDLSNLTDVFSKSIFDAIADGRTPTLADIEAGVTPTFDFKNNSFLQASLTNLLKSLAPPQEKIITIKSNRQTMGKYANEAIKVLESSDELESDKIIIAAFQNQDFQGLDKAIESYKTIYDEFKKLETPTDLQQFQGDSLAMLYQTRELLILIRRIKEDPLKALMAWQLYVKIHDQGVEVLALRATNSLKNYYQGNQQ